MSGAAAGRPSRSLISSPPAAFSLCGRNATLTKLNSETLRIPIVFDGPASDSARAVTSALQPKSQAVAMP
jgi:hypothetical protein